MKKQKHFFHGSLKPVVNNKQFIGPKGIVVEEQEGKRVTAVAEDLLFSLLPEKEQGDYVAQLQHIGMVDVEG